MRTPPPPDDLRFSNTTGILQKKKTMWFIGVEVEQETSAPPPKKNPGSAPAFLFRLVFVQRTKSFYSDCGFFIFISSGFTVYYVIVFVRFY